MTQVYLERDGDRYTVSCRGHAEGSPEVCAAVSCLVYTLAGYLHNSTAEILSERMEAGNALIQWRGGAEAAFDLCTIGFLQLGAQYGEYIQTDLKNIL